MREIKFRAWSPSDKRMVPYEDMLLYDHGTEPVSFVMNLRGEPYDYRYMQYTGLTDKNGKEIYEGDIVRLTLDNQNGVIKYKDAMFYVEWEFDTALNGITGGLEVIGNIYSNPELLKTEAAS